MNKVLLILFIYTSIGTSCLTDARAQVSTAQFESGKQLYYQGHYDSAVVVISELIKFYKAEDNIAALVRAQYLLGETLANIGKCDEAIKTLEEALATTKESLNDGILLSNGLYYLARANSGCKNKSDLAKKYLYTSINLLSSSVENDSATAFRYTQLGYCFNRLGMYDSANYFLKKALIIRNNNSKVDPADLALTLYNLARNKENTDDLKASLDYALQALELQQSVFHENHPSVSNTIAVIGNSYKQFGNYKKSIEYYEQSLEIRKKSLGAQHVNLGASYYSIGNLYGHMEDYHLAIEFIREGNRIVGAKFGFDSPIVLTYRAYLAGMYIKVEQLQTAESIIIEVVKDAERTLRSNHPYLAIIYNVQGEIYAEQNQISLAKIYFNKAIAIHREAYGDQSLREADIHTKLGEAYVKENEFYTAENHYLNALTIYNEKVGADNSKMSIVLKSLGDLHSKQGKYVKANKYYRDALRAICLKTDSTTANFPEIKTLTDKALALEIVSNTALNFTTSFTRDSIREDLIMANEADRYGMNIIDHIFQGFQLSSSKIKLQKDSRKIYKRALNNVFVLRAVTGNEKYLTQAFDIIERSKSSLLVENLKNKAAMRFSGIPDSLIDMENQLHIEHSYWKTKIRAAQNDESASLEELQQKLFEAQKQIENFKQELSSIYPAYYDFKYNFKNTSLADTQDQMSEKTVIFDFFEGDSFVYCLALSKHNSVLYKFKNDTDYKNLLANYHESLTNKNLIINHPMKADSLYSYSAFTLYNKLLKPGVEVMNNSIEKFIIIPDNELSKINFSTLLTTAATSLPINYTQLDYLLNDYAISYSHSTDQMILGQKITSGNGFIGFAPSYNEVDYNIIDSTSHPLTYALVRDGNLPLPGAIEEVESITEIMNGNSWTYENASESNFITYAKDHNIIHLAMHSLLNGEEPEYSELLFNSSKDTINDGYLTISEIYNIQLNTELVVLSACSSGSGKIQIGEGPISFSRAFSYAGCPSVVMSLWKIPDASTKEIMISFYQNLKEGKSKDVSLKSAQLDYLQNTSDPIYQHPYFWASFVAMGDMNAIQSESFHLSWEYYILGILFLIILVAWRKKHLLLK